MVLYLLAANNLVSSKPEERFSGVYVLLDYVYFQLSSVFKINECKIFQNRTFKRGSNRFGVKKWEQTFDNTLTANEI